MIAASRVIFAFSLSTLLWNLPRPVHGWRWGGQQVVASINKEEFERDVKAYKARVAQGIDLTERMRELRRLIELYKPIGIPTEELEEEYVSIHFAQPRPAVAQVVPQPTPPSVDPFVRTLYQSGKYDRAIGALNETMAQRPLDAGENLTLQRLTHIAALTPSLLGMEPADRPFRRAVSYYLENRPAKALRALRYAQDLDPDHALIEPLRSLVLANFPGTPSPSTPPGLDFIDASLRSAQESVREGRLFEAMDDWQAILDVHPHHAVALSRMAAAYATQGDLEKSERLWKRAAAAQPSQPALPPAASIPLEQTYLIRYGDTLWTIAEKFYGDAIHWGRIYAANRELIGDTRTLTAGQTLKIPSAPSSK